MPFKLKQVVDWFNEIEMCNVLSPHGDKAPRTMSRECAHHLAHII